MTSVCVGCSATPVGVMMPVCVIRKVKKKTPIHGSNGISPSGRASRSRSVFGGPRVAPNRSDWGNCQIRWSPWLSVLSVNKTKQCDHLISVLTYTAPHMGQDGGFRQSHAHTNTQRERKVNVGTHLFHFNQHNDSKWPFKTKERRDKNNLITQLLLGFILELSAFLLCNFSLFSSTLLAYHPFYFPPSSASAPSMPLLI